MTVLPDGSCFGVMSFPLPKDHWIYAERQYAEGADEPVDLPAPILTHALHDQVVAAIRYAVRGATMCGKEMDFDPDALVQNAVYALCGHYTKTTVIEDPRDKVLKLEILECPVDECEACPERGDCTTEETLREREAEALAAINGLGDSAKLTGGGADE